jgi:hypothetical protein
VVRGSVASEHFVHLFDEPRSLAETVARHLLDGWRRDDALLVVARPKNWALASAELEVSGCPVAAIAAAGRLIVLDAATTLATFLVDGEPEPEKFHAHVGTLVHRLCGESTAGLTVYGEMVDLLAAQGNFIAAERLEALWNGLASQCSFRLLCGYSAAHFGDERNTRHLDQICGLHDQSTASPTDLLASWLLNHRRSRFHLGA